MRGILQFILYSVGGHHLTPTAPLGREMRVRSREQLVAIRDAHGTAFKAALTGAINAEEYLLLDAEGPGKVVSLRPAIPRIVHDELRLADSAGAPRED